MTYASLYPSVVLTTLPVSNKRKLSNETETIRRNNRFAKLPIENEKKKFANSINKIFHMNFLLYVINQTL